MQIITLPNGRPCGLATYCRAWRTLKTLPPGEPVAGWNYHPETASSILWDMREGMHHRINRHDRTRATTWRKMQPVWQIETLRAARQLNAHHPRLVIRWLPIWLRGQFQHRLEEA